MFTSIILSMSTAEICTMIIACCALILTVWQGHLVRRHGKLAIIPALSTWTHSTPDSMTFELSNKGHGTARIESFDFYRNSKIVTPEELMSDVLNLINYPAGNVRLGGMQRNTFLEKGETICILKITMNSQQNSNFFNEILNRFDLKVRYTSLHGETFLYDSSKFN